MFTDKCHEEIDRQLGAQGMFTPRLMAQCYQHQAIIEEIATDITEWLDAGVSLSSAKKVLVGLGYNNVQIADAMRLKRECDASKVPLDAEFDTSPEGAAYGVVATVC